MNTRTQFQKNRDLANYWSGVIGDPKFDQVLTHVRAAVVEYAPSRDELRGVELALHTLATIGEAEPGGFQFPSPGITHEIETLRTGTKTRKQNQKNESL